jgi:hypothetical protein
MAMANHRARKKIIYSLMGPNGVVQDNDKILRVVVAFYKNLSRKESRGNFPYV